MIEPQGEIILLRHEEEKKSTLIMPGNVAQSTVLAVVVAVSDAEKHVHNAKPGDRVIIGPTARGRGLNLGRFGMSEDLFLLNEAEILAIVR